VAFAAGDIPALPSKFVFEFGEREPNDIQQISIDQVHKLHRSALYSVTTSLVEGFARVNVPLDFFTRKPTESHFGRNNSRHTSSFVGAENRERGFDVVRFAAQKPQHTSGLGPIFWLT
jgi:hypothetical protein